MYLSHFSPWVPLGRFIASTFGLQKYEALIITDLFVYPALESNVAVLNLSVLTHSKITFSNNFSHCSVPTLKLRLIVFKLNITWQLFIVH